jgi:electron-transferring-flavoprotein dehydrogenase
VFPGGALIGCDAGYLNAARIKGSHAAIKTGMLAPKRWRQRSLRAAPGRADAYPEAFEKSWLNGAAADAQLQAWFKG